MQNLLIVDFYSRHHAHGSPVQRKGVCCNVDLFLFFYPMIPSVPSGPPRKVEVEAVNSTSVKVLWRSPVLNRHHGQIRGYQVHYVRMLNGEPVGHSAIKDILIDDAQVSTHMHITLSCEFLFPNTAIHVLITHNLAYTAMSNPCIRQFNTEKTK